MDNNFNEGQRVICISEDFPLIKEYGGSGNESKITPKKGESIEIDEILGEFLRFDKYDTEESFNWWKHDRFIPEPENSYEEKEIEELYIKKIT